MIDNFNIEVGKRLREIRLIYNEGFKITTQQMALLLGETSDKIVNYELGRAALPIKLLAQIHDKGFSSLYIMKGEGGIYADNEEGIRMKRIMQNRLKTNSEFNERLLYVTESNNLYFIEKEELPLRAAAGRIVL